jgi:hypothetical protein
MIRRLALFCACVAVLVALSAWAVGEVHGPRGEGASAASSQVAGVQGRSDVRMGGLPAHERRPCRERFAGSLTPCAAFATLSSAAQVAPPSPARLLFALHSDRIPQPLLDEARFRPPRPIAGAARA